MNQEIMEKFKPFLWSYDTTKMDLESDKKRIITNVLNLGTREVTDLLFEFYSNNDIREVVKNPKPGEWSDKSLNYWSIILGIKPRKIENVLRYIR